MIILELGGGYSYHVRAEVEPAKTSKVAEYATACNVPDTCTTKATKVAYLLGDCLDRVRRME